MDFIGIIVSIVYLVRRMTLGDKSLADFPGVSQEDFDTWKRLEKRRLNVILWIMWPWTVCYLLIVFPLYIFTRHDELLVLGFIFLPLVVAAFVTSYAMGKTAREMKKAFPLPPPAQP